MDDYGKLQELINWLLVLIPLGGAVRVAYCFIAMQMDEDSQSFRTRAKNAIIFTVIALGLSGLVRILMHYFAI